MQHLDKQGCVSSKCDVYMGKLCSIEGVIYSIYNLSNLETRGHGLASLVLKTPSSNREQFIPFTHCYTLLMSKGHNVMEHKTSITYLMDNY